MHRAPAPTAAILLVGAIILGLTAIGSVRLLVLSRDGVVVAESDAQAAVPAMTLAQ